MIEKRIYSQWAFSDNEAEMAKCNSEIYKELKKKYRIYRHDLKMELTNGVDCNFAEYDVIIGRKAGYAHALYRIHKNAPKLSTVELALLCDGGNLCFGYTTNGQLIKVHED